MPKEKKIKKNKKELKFRRKINAICVDFRFYSKAKKDAIIEPCVDEFHKKVNSGFSEKEATKLICSNCQDALERKYEKHNKFLSLLLFAFAIVIFACILEMALFSSVFDTLEPTLGLLIWVSCVILLFILFIIWAGLTHNGRWFGYLFIALYILLWVATFATVVYLSYYSLDGSCLTRVRFMFNSEFFLDVRQFTGELNSLGECISPVGRSSFVDFSGYNIDTIGTLSLFGIVAIIYLCEHARLNTHYCRNKINNLCTQYGINKKVDRKEIREGALLQYYTYLDQGLSKKDANKQVLAETAEILGRDHKKHNRLLFSFVIVLIFFIIGVVEYVGCYRCFIDAYYWNFIYILPVVDAFILAILFIVMCGDHTRFYWFDFVIVFILFVSVIAMEISVALVGSGHYDPPDAGQIRYEAGPFYIKQIMERFEEILTEDGRYEYNSDVIVSTYYDYGIMYDTIIGIILAVIIIPIYSVCQHHINKERKTHKL